MVHGIISTLEHEDQVSLIFNITSSECKLLLFQIFHIVIEKNLTVRSNRILGTRYFEYRSGLRTTEDGALFFSSEIPFTPALSLNMGGGGTGGHEGDRSPSSNFLDRGRS